MFETLTTRDFGTLRSVSALFEYPKWASVYWFCFEGGIVRIGVEPETDQIQLTYPNQIDPLSVDMSQLDPFAYSIGSRMTWKWLFSNQNGYVDGVQIAFRSPGTGEQSLQFVAAGSMILLGKVEEIPFDSFGPAE